MKLKRPRKNTAINPTDEDHPLNYAAVSADPTNLPPQKRPRLNSASRINRAGNLDRKTNAPLLDDLDAKQLESLMSLALLGKDKDPAQPSSSNMPGSLPFIEPTPPLCVAPQPLDDPGSNIKNVRRGSTAARSSPVKVEVKVERTMAAQSPNISSLTLKESKCTRPPSRTSSPQTSAPMLSDSSPKTASSTPPAYHQATPKNLGAAEVNIPKPELADRSTIPNTAAAQSNANSAIPSSSNYINPIIPHTDESRSYSRSPIPRLSSLSKIAPSEMVSLPEPSTVESRSPSSPWMSVDAGPQPVADLSVIPSFFRKPATAMVASTSPSRPTAASAQLPPDGDQTQSATGGDPRMHSPGVDGSGRPLTVHPSSPPSAASHPSIPPMPPSKPLFFSSPAPASSSRPSAASERPWPTSPSSEVRPHSPRKMISPPPTPPTANAPPPATCRRPRTSSLRAEPSSKRQKVPVPASGRQPEQDKAFWYTDGSVIINCGDRAFKLHKSRLTIASPYFASLFGQPRLAEREGCDVYDISNRCSLPDQFSYILNCWEHPRKLEVKISKESPLRLCEIYRGAKQLGFKDVMAHVLIILNQWFPAKVHDLPFPVAKSDALEVIKFAYDMNQTSLLHAAFYEALVVPSEDFDARKIVAAVGLDNDSCAMDVLEQVRHVREILAATWTKASAFTPTVHPSVCPHSNPGRKPTDEEKNEKFKRWSMLMNMKTPNGPDLLTKYFYDPVRGMEGIRRAADVRPRGSEDCTFCLGSIEQWWKSGKERVWKTVGDQLSCLLQVPPLPPPP